MVRQFVAADDNPQYAGPDKPPEEVFLGKKLVRIVEVPDPQEV